MKPCPASSGIRSASATPVRARSSPMVAKNAGFAVSTRCAGPASDAKTAMDCPNNAR